MSLPRLMTHDFGFFWPPLTFSTLWTLLTKSQHFRTTYPLPLVNVVCERPLTCNSNCVEDKLCTQFFQMCTQFLNLFISFWHLWFDRKSFSLWQICFYGNFWNYSTVKSELKVLAPIWGLALLYFALLLLNNFFMDVLELKSLRLQLENMCDPLRRQIWNPIFQSQLFLLLVMLLFFILYWFTWTYFTFLWFEIAQ